MCATARYRAFLNYGTRATRHLPRHLRVLIGCRNVVEERSLQHCFSAVAGGVILALLTCVGVHAQAPSGPAFDCGRAQSTLSQAICRDPASWESDWALSSSYWAAYFSVEGADRAQLRDGHLAWLKSVEDGCGLAANATYDGGRAAGCVVQRYRSRATGYRNSLSRDALAEASLRPEMLMDIQARLIALGFLTGVADGVFGAGTRFAIRAYRQTLGHAPADFLDAQERAAILRSPSTERNPGRDPSGGNVFERRPSAPDPRFPPDLAGRGYGQVRGPRVDPNAAIPGMMIDMLGGSVPSRRQSPSYYADWQQEQAVSTERRADEFNGSVHHAPNSVLPPREMPRGGAAPGSEFADGATAVVTAPLAGRTVPDTDAGIRTVEVKGTGDTADTARKDAARLAIQQVVGVFVDNRRRVELNVSDRKVSEIVDEKLISYTNAYVNKLDVVKTEQKGGVYEITARVGVAVKPLLKVLQDNAVPVVPFDTVTAASTVETLGQEKTAAVELYTDLVAKAEAMLRVGVGTPQVDPNLPSSSDQAWLRIPLTYSVNDDAAREWRTKFNLIAQKRAEVRIKVVPSAPGRPGQPSCLPPILSMSFARGFNGEQRSFLSERTPQQQQGVAVCFASYPTAEGVVAECLGRTFVTNEQYRQRCPAEGPCLHFDQRAASLRLVVEFLDKDGSVVFASRHSFKSYPSVTIGSSRSAPQGQEKSFFNFCVPSQESFFAVAGQDTGASFGDVLVFPTRGSKLRSYLNLLLPNVTIARITSVRARIAKDAT